MTHSHLAVQHLIKQAENYQNRLKNSRTTPGWLLSLADELSELFLPLRGVARVGYECQLADEHWELTMFLGREEHVGGPDDGKFRHCNFQLDVLTLSRYFDQLDQMVWNALPEAIEDGQGSPVSFLVIRGIIEGEPLVFRACSVAPEDAGIGLKVFQDGTCELA